MNKTSKTESDAEAKKRAEARTAILLAVIFGTLIVVMIGGMLIFDLSTEKLNHGASVPADSAAAADH